MKEIQLTKGMSTLVDDEDFNYLNQWKWYAHNRRNKYYAARSNWIKIEGKNYCETISLHRVLLNVIDKSIFIDHKDGNSLNNQKTNLRIATTSQNNRNAISRKNSSSKYLGVSFRKDCGKWRGIISHNKKNYSLGTFINEVDAAVAYNNKAILLHGEFAKLNIIEV
jgi:hypothetical protein